MADAASVAARKTQQSMFVSLPAQRFRLSPMTFFARLIQMEGNSRPEEAALLRRNEREPEKEERHLTGCRRRFHLLSYARAAALPIAAFIVGGCSGSSFVVARPVARTPIACSAPSPWNETVVSGGLESAPPTTMGSLTLVRANFDDRLTSPTPREMTWGDGDRLLTVEHDRAIIWDVRSGRAIASVRLPEGIQAVAQVTAAPDLSRAAALVRHSQPITTGDAGVVGIDFGAGVARVLEGTPRKLSPFLVSSDGASLIVGGDVWDTTAWTRRKSVLGASEVVLPHPKRASEVVPLRPSATGLIPVFGVHVHQRLLACGPRLLRYAEAYWDMRRQGTLEPVPGKVSVSPIDEETPRVEFAIAKPETIVVISPPGHFVGTLDQEFTLRSTTSVEPLRVLGGTGWANRALLSEDGRIVVLGYVEPVVSTEESGRPRAPNVRHGRKGTPRTEAWDLDTHTRLLTTSESLLLDSEMLLTPDGRYLWQPRAHQVLDLRRGTPIALRAPVRTVSPSGLAILDDPWGGTTVVNLVTGTELSPARRSLVIAASDDGRHLATIAREWDLQLESRRRCSLVLPATRYYPFIFESARFSADSSTFVVRPWNDYLLRAWDTETDGERYALRGNGATVTYSDPLREVYVVPSTPSAGPLSPVGATVLDVRTGKVLASGAVAASSEPPPKVESTWLRSPITARALSPDGVLAVIANFQGDLAVVNVADGRTAGSTRFEERHDFARIAWFTDPRRFALQTARGAIFEFAIGS